MTKTLQSLKQQVFEKEYAFLNERQRQAIRCVNGPLLVLAGAGSGKTTVLINRIAHLLEWGDAFSSEANEIPLAPEESAILERYLAGEEDLRPNVVSLLRRPLAKPWNVLAITFTNKAANELKERLAAKLGEKDGSAVHCGTFHSICLRILRKEIYRLGYTSSFTIYDTDDSIRVIKDCLAELDVDDKMFPPRSCLSQMGALKDRMATPEAFLQESQADFRLKTLAQIYALYQKRLKAANALDFDDLIACTVQLLLQDREVLSYYQSRYRYIVVDEYQDTNNLQYRLVELLSRAHQNLCVVGDDDQSIYKFRGATIANILNFEEQFPQATVIRLEQNYRSTQTILDAANAVIEHNEGRKRKTLWTENGTGAKIQLFCGHDDFAEGNFITGVIQENVKQGGRCSDHAILYRMNAQSNAIERALVKSGLAYHIVGGTKFFERKEIRDMLAYFHLIANPADTLRLKRVLGEPKRGIGPSTVRAAEEIAEKTETPLFFVMKQADAYHTLSKKATLLLEFTAVIDALAELSLTLPLATLLDEVLERTGYRKALSAQGVEGRVRLENIEELKSNLVKYHEEQGDAATLLGFLEEVSLYTDLDHLNSDQEQDRVVLMTVHSAKGLEFSSVFLLGLEEGLFPSKMAKREEDEMEEERRLAYVAITRAKKQLYITRTRQRMIFGQVARNAPSRFLSEIPTELLQEQKQAQGLHLTSAQLAEQRAVAVTARTEEIKQTQSQISGFSEKPAPLALDYAVGDAVSHSVFGTGMVLSLKPMGNDILVEVAFDGVGTKKIMQNFAKLQKL